jgi:hypothetical protein
MRLWVAAGLPAAPPAGRLVAAAVLALAAAAGGYVARFSENAPVVDEWELTFPLLGGQDPWARAFSRLNEHLDIPGNLAYVALHKLTDLDFRAGLAATVATLTAAAVLVAAAARRIRGRSHVADVFIPAVLLHWGHQYNNLLMGYQLVFALFALAGAALLWVSATAEVGREFRTGVRAGLVLRFVMLNGGMGLSFVPVIAGWVIYLVGRVRRTGGTRRALVVLLPLVPAAAYTAYVLLTTPRTSASGPTPPPGQFALAILQYLGMGLGSWFPQANLHVAGPLVGAAYLAVAAGLVAAVARNDNRPRAVGLLAVLGGHLAVAVGIAAVRGGAAVDRYVTISAVGVLATYLASVACGPALPPRLGAVLALTAATAIVVANLGPGERFGLIHRTYYRGFGADLKAGMPVEFLADKYRAPFLVDERFAADIERLRVSRVRYFAAAVPTPVMAAVPAGSGSPVQFTLGAGAGIDLPPPGREVFGVRVTYVLERAVPWLELRTTGPAPAGGRSRTASAFAPTGTGRHTVALWVNDAPAAMRLDPACPTFGMTIRSVEWLIPPGGKAP